MAASPKPLIVMDFDYTIVEGNYDERLVKLVPTPLPDDLKALYHVETGWTTYMNGLLSFLHEHGVEVKDIKHTVLQSPLVDGMKEFFHYCSQQESEIIILSDANQLFIEWLLKKYDIYEQVAHVYANPVECSEDGRLVETYYHAQQTWCSLSSDNLCKGQALKEHIQQQRANGVTYSCIIYIGDGGNDFCPTRELSDRDYVFARKNFALEKRIEENIETVAAEVIHWKSGEEILQALQGLP